MNRFIQYRNLCTDYNNYLKYKHKIEGGCRCFGCCDIHEEQTPVTAVSMAAVHSYMQENDEQKKNQEYELIHSVQPVVNLPPEVAEEKTSSSDESLKTQETDKISLDDQENTPERSSRERTEKLPEIIIKESEESIPKISSENQKK